MAPDPTSSIATAGQFEATFELDRTTYRPGDSITGRATLRYLGRDTVTISGSGAGPFAFAFREVGGSGRGVEPVWPGDCLARAIDSAKSVVQEIYKSGGESNEDPDSDFEKRFLGDPLIRLPPGIWDVVAETNVIVDPMCRADPIDLSAMLRIRVIE